MPLEPFHNYFGITVKNEKNHEKLVFSIFDCDPEIIMECLQQKISENFTPKKTMINFFFTKKKKLYVRHLQNDRFGDFETEPETPFGTRNFFFH